MNRQAIHTSIALSLVWFLTNSAGSAGTSTSGSGQEQIDRQTKIAQIFEIISASPPSVPVPPEIINEPNMAIRKEYSRKRNIEFEKIEAQYVKARAELMAMGEAVIEPIIQEYCRHRSSTFDKHAVLVLKEIGTAKAQEGLLNMALGQGKFGPPNRWAARNYLQAVKNKADVRKLLVSDRSDILSDALLALKGEPVDEELLKKLEELLESKHHSVRFNAAAVMGEDPSENCVKEKVSAIISAIDKAEKWSESQQQFPGYQAVGTIADHSYFRFTAALCHMRGADACLVSTTNKVKGKARWCILMARAWRGDSSLKVELYQIIKDPDAGLIRSLAVRSLIRIGTLEDLPFLWELAKTDPLAVASPQDSFPDPATGERPEKIYPVRLEAKIGIERIEKKYKAKQLNNNSADKTKG